MNRFDEVEGQLIEDILAGEKHKYRQLVERHAPLVFHIVRRFVHDSEDEVEEQAQQIFVKAYERLDTFKGNSRFSSWLYMIAKNHCRDYAKNIRRKNRTLSNLNEGELNSLLINDEESPDRQIQLAQQQQLLSKALDSIDDTYSEAFLLKYRDELSYKAMSKRLGASVSALKVRVHRARKELKNYFNEHQIQL